MKRRVNISLSEDTANRLKNYALNNHTTVSQAITDWIWSVDIHEKEKSYDSRNEKDRKTDIRW